ncbi:unnamed protein product [Meganyctiphanes norvegica]|uniref:BHLH domain-containing protein n=1 Tax=Meganyctiphanes norvegica TaxID=48144 RepID=A0AAV2S5S0_MEGNR
MITCINTMEDEAPSRDNCPKDFVTGGSENLRDTVVDQENIHWSETNNNIMKDPTPEEKAEKYGLRPRTIIKRLQQETKRQEPPQPKPKQKRTKKARPAPLSKYRRKTANARERDRMKAVNVAFESLRRVLPESVEQQQGVPANTTTKITTLRLAVNYIQALTKVLENPQQQQQQQHEYTRENVIIKQEQNCDIKSEREVKIERSQITHLIDTKNVIINTHYPKYTSTLDQKYQQISVPQQQPYMPELNVMEYEVQTPGDVLPKQPQDFCSLLTSSPEYSYFSLSSNSSSSLDSHGSSTSDLDELLSEDSHLLEGNLNVFQDISSFSETDPFDVLLSTDIGCDKSGICYTDQMYS